MRPPLSLSANCVIWIWREARRAAKKMLASFARARTCTRAREQDALRLWLPIATTKTPTSPTLPSPRVIEVVYRDFFPRGVHVLTDAVTPIRACTPLFRGREDERETNSS